LIRVHVEAVGIAGPGLPGWTASRAVLAGAVPYQPAPFTPPSIALLPPAERRRAGIAIRLAIGVGIEALTQAGRDPATMAMVFTSSSGDTETVSDILCVLATDRREVSPTRFHNSVHNAPAGYWAVATGSGEPSTSLCAADASFSAGLLDAAAQAVVDDRPVTLVAYDLPYPEPLHRARPIAGTLALALVLTPWQTERCFASLTLLPCDAGPPATPMADSGLEQLRLGNPAGRGLPLLAALAVGRPATVWLDSTSGTGGAIQVTPC
jgi:hypothetical protein